MEEQSLLIVDDHELFRAGVAGLIMAEQLPFQVSEAASVAEAISLIDRQPFDCIVLDYDLPDDTGLAVLAHVRQRGLDCRVIMLTGTGSREVARIAHATGADAVLAKRGDGLELLGALQGITKPFISRHLEMDPEQRRILDSLTNRERETLSILLRGASTQEVADELGVSFKTAETHRTNLMSKLDAHSYGDLIRCARELGLS